VLEVDDLFKANKDAIAAAYSWCRPNNTTFDIQRATKLVATMGFPGSEYEKVAAQAYSLCKQFIVDEMENFDSYQDMKRHEFYEFIGRLAYLLYPEEAYPGMPLVKKIEQLLSIMFSKVTTFKLQLPNFQENVESDSDYEDDWVDQILSEL
jgi:hypothetical protein